MVELRGLEPLTPTLPVWCATSCAIAPKSAVRMFPDCPNEVTPSQLEATNRLPTDLLKVGDPLGVGGVDFRAVDEHRRSALAAEIGQCLLGGIACGRTDELTG